MVANLRFAIIIGRIIIKKIFEGVIIAKRYFLKKKYYK